MSQAILPQYMLGTLSYVRSGLPDLTHRQMALILVIYLTPGPHTVRGLALELNVSKPIVTRALDTLCQFRYAQRVRDTVDRRSIFIEATTEGHAFLDALVQAVDSQPH